MELLRRSAQMIDELRQVSMAGWSSVAETARAAALACESCEEYDYQNDFLSIEVAAKDQLARIGEYVP